MSKHVYRGDLLDFSIRHLGRLVSALRTLEGRLLMIQGRRNNR